VKHTRVEVAVRPEREDPFAEHVKGEIASTLGYRVNALRTAAVYTIRSDLSREMIEEFAREVLTDPVLSFCTIDGPVALRFAPFTWAVEVSFKPGVTDNVGHTAAEVLGMLARRRGVRPGDEYRVYKAVQYLFDAPLSREQVSRIGREILYNELIEEIEIRGYDEFVKRGGFPARGREAGALSPPRVERISLDLSDSELLALSDRRVLALTLEEMKFFRSHFERPEVRARRESLGIGPEPTDVELECFAQTQSEHCKHKIFNARISYRERTPRGERTETVTSLFKTFIKAATERIAREKDWLVSVFTDNAGVIRFDEEHNLAFKVETHNTPSALDPYGGSITGIVGVDRDPAGTGMGSRLIAHTDVLCFGDPGYAGELPPMMMHPKRVMAGVVKGIEDGGNKCGIPTVNGGVIFDGSFGGKPLVFCGSVGIMPARVGGRDSHLKEALPGDVVVMVGGRIGKDGIHGATFSSEEIKESSPVQAVQIGDPITQKKMLDMLLEARDRLLYRGITDNGAGGLSSSVGEMAQLSGGASIALDRAPLKYPGLDPWEILLSEAQERMTLAVPRERLSEFLALAESRDVLAVPIGEFTDSGMFHVAYGGKTVCSLELDFLHSSIPMSLEAEWEEPEIREKAPDPSVGPERAIRELVSDLNSCSREPIIRRYDHEVGGGTVIKPLVGSRETGPSDAGVIAPVPGSRRGFALACGINPFLSRVDAYRMAALAVDEALRNAVAVGADPDRVALLDNFCWPDPVFHPKKTPDGRHKLAQLVRAARGLYETAVAYGAPFISGKDSMKNDYKVGDHKVSVLPTILVSALGIVPDIALCVTSDFKAEGDLIYLLGSTERHLGESLYYRKYGGSSKSVPAVDAEANMRLYRAYFEAARRGLLASGHDLSEGGLAVAVAECCIGGGIGAEVDLGAGGGISDEDFLFSETPGRILAGVRPEREAAFLSVMEGVPRRRMGKVSGSGRLVIKGSGGAEIADIGVGELVELYRGPLYAVLVMSKGER
jgi:phosphoribosylformylglycinamidine synthase